MMNSIVQRQYPDNTEAFPLYPKKKKTYIILQKKNKLKEEKWKGMNLAINYLGNFSQNSKFGMATKKLSMSDLAGLYDNKKVNIPLFKNVTLKEKMKPKFLNSSFREILLPSKPNESQQYIDDYSEDMGDVFSFNDNQNNDHCDHKRHSNSNNNHNNNINNYYYSEKKLSLANSTNNLSFQEQLYSNNSESLFHKMGFGRHFNNISLTKFTKNNMMRFKCSIIREALPVFPVIKSNKRKSSNSIHRQEISLSNNIRNKEISYKLNTRHQPIKLKQGPFSLLNNTCKFD